MFIYLEDTHVRDLDADVGKPAA